MPNPIRPLPNISAVFPHSATENNIADVPRNNGYSPVLQKVEFIDRRGVSVSSVQSGDPLTVRIHYRHNEEFKDPHFGFIVETVMGVKIFWVQTKMQTGHLPDIAPTGVIECRIPRLPLLAGTYFLTLGCGAQSHQLDHIERACQIQVTEADVFGTGRNPNPKISLIFVDADWEVTQGTAVCDKN